MNERNFWNSRGLCDLAEHRYLSEIAREVKVGLYSLDGDW